MRILSVVGARPQFVKAAMMATAFDTHNRQAAERDRVEHLLVHTGQHYERNLSDIFFEQLPLPQPDFNLEVGSGSHGAQTGAMLERIESVLIEEKPDMMVVYGDTNSTLAGALAASKLHIPVAHIEAGLRSFNRRMPEEINRIVTDHLSDLLICPTPTAVENLRKEGITEGAFQTGDVMLDAVQAFRPLAVRRSAKLLSRLGIDAGGYILVTLHRAENTDPLDRLEGWIETLVRLERPTVFPMHPRLRERLSRTSECDRLRRKLDEAQDLRVIAPVSYLDMLALEENARIVLTDSGGVQKEAFFLGVPCLTLRKETEWVETLQGNWNRLMGDAPETILPVVESLWSDEKARPQGPPDLAPFGSGDAANRAIQSLLTKS